MDSKLRLICFLVAAACFVLAALGGARKGKAAQSESLLPLGLLFWLLPQLWDTWERL